VLEALQARGAHRTTSLQTPCGTNEEAGDTLGDTVATTERGFGLASSATFAALLPAITPREREVLCLYFEDDLTQRQIAHRIGVSQMQTSRIDPQVDRPPHDGARLSQTAFRGDRTERTSARRADASSQNVARDDDHASAGARSAPA
jgi:hypothetical protein